MAFLQGPSQTSSLLTRRFPPIVSFSPKTSMSICQPMPLVLSSPALVALRSSWHICCGRPWVLHTQPTVKLNSLSFSPNHLLLLYSSLSQWHQRSPRFLPAKGGGFPSPSFPISRPVLSVLPLQFHLNLCPYLHPHCHDLSSLPMNGEPFKWLLGLASPSVCLCSVMSDSCMTPWTVAHQAPLSMGFPRQEYWSELPLPSPGDLLDPGIRPESPASPTLAGGLFTTELPGLLSVINSYPAAGVPHSFNHTISQRFQDNIKTAIPPC